MIQKFVVVIDDIGIFRVSPLKTLDLLPATIPQICCGRDGFGPDRLYVATRTDICTSCKCRRSASIFRMSLKFPRCELRHLRVAWV